jgi:hypothetical protein
MDITRVIKITENLRRVVLTKYFPEKFGHIVTKGTNRMVRKKIGSCQGDTPCRPNNFIYLMI